jgi:hypothetical protein
MKRFVACFVIACAISSPAFAQTIVNGDNMALQSSGTASGSAWNLNSDGYVGTYIQVPTSGSTVSFDLNAAGISSQGVLPDSPPVGQSIRNGSTNRENQQPERYGCNRPQLQHGRPRPRFGANLR